MVGGFLMALGAVFSLTPLATPAIALAAGIALALTVGNPWRDATSAISGRLLQVSVVGLGFGIPLDALVRAGATGIGYTALVIIGVFAAGLLLARWLKVERRVAVLITAGTSICGGSAIAALGPAIGATGEAMGVSLATVFVLNAVALYAFPLIGHLANLSQHQFGVWAAVAIHDTSSVVGAAASYGAVALRDATILKLARALWILPLTLIAPLMLKRPTPDGTTTRPPIPWFIALFVLAAASRSLTAPSALHWFDSAHDAARVSLVLTLFLIGSNLTRAQLRAVGVRPFVHGLTLWIGVAGATLAAVIWGVRS